jgi:hypothetical protein
MMQQWQQQQQQQMGSAQWFMHIWKWIQRAFARAFVKLIACFDNHVCKSL